VKLDNYDRSAQVLDVVLRHKFCLGQPVTVSDFICTHNRFENPQYIIDNDNITLMTITEQDAVFAKAKDKGTRPYCMSVQRYNVQKLFYRLFYHITPILKSLRWLKINERIEYKL